MGHSSSMTLVLSDKQGAIAASAFIGFLRVVVLSFVVSCLMANCASDVLVEVLGGGGVPDHSNDPDYSGPDDPYIPNQ